MMKLRYALLFTIVASINTICAQKADSIKVKVFFALDKFNIAPAAKQTLDDFIKHHREITWINIEAFTDSRASLAYNDKLAHNRASSVQNYLLANGLSKNCETHINAFGKRKLLDIGHSETAHQNNRVVILTCYIIPPTINTQVTPIDTAKPKAVVVAPAPPKDTVIPIPPVVVTAPVPAPPKDTVKPTPPVVVAPVPTPPKDTVKQLPPPIVAAKADTGKPMAVIKAPPAVESSPAEVVKITPPAADTADDAGGRAIQVKENVPTGEVDRGLTERIILAIKHAKVGQSLVLHTIYFEEGRHVFVKTATTALNAVLEVMKTRPTIEFEVQGHVCCTDSLMEDALDFDTHQFDLSYARAKAVAAYLAKNGISADRVKYQVGFGSRRRIVYPEKTVADRNLNRRVEFKIIKK